jgi:hypothetical protein
MIPLLGLRGDAFVSWGCGSRGGGADRTYAYSGGGLAMPLTAMTTAAALISSSGDRGCCWQAARDGDNL